MATGSPARESAATSAKERADEKTPTTKIARKQPSDWAAVTGHVSRRAREVVFNGVAPSALDGFSAAHRGAAIPHGWKHDADDPHVTREDYLAALAASQGSDDKGRVGVHQPAMSRDALAKRNP